MQQVKKIYLKQRNLNKQIKTKVLIHKKIKKRRRNQKTNSRGKNSTKRLTNHNKTIL